MSECWRGRQLRTFIYEGLELPGMPLCNLEASYLWLHNCLIDMKLTARSAHFGRHEDVSECSNTILPKFKLMHAFCRKSLRPRSVCRTRLRISLLLSSLVETIKVVCVGNCTTFDKTDNLSWKTVSCTSLQAFVFPLRYYFGPDYTRDKEWKCSKWADFSIKPSLVVLQHMEQWAL